MTFIHAPNHILKFAILRRQPSNDLVRSSRRVNRQFRMKKYCLADLKLVLVHRISPPSRRRVYHLRGLNDSPRTLLDGDRVPRLDGKYSAASGEYQIRRILQVLAVQNPTVSKIGHQKPKFGKL